MITEIIADFVRANYNIEITPVLSRPEAQFGDAATNVALQLAKQVGANPREIADAIAGNLRDTGKFEEVNVAGPGFINVRFSDEVLIAQLSEPQKYSQLAREAVIETNNPNPFKAMHIGHSFNAILGDTLANLLEISGVNTHRVSYHGDVGAHVGKSMYSLLRYVDGDPAKLDAIPKEERNSFMSRMYAEGATAYKEDEAAKAEIDELARQSFTREDPVYAAVYDTCKSWSFEQIDAIVERLGNQKIEKRYLESEADPIGVETVKAHTPDVFTQSNGAYVFEGSKYGSFDNAFVSSRGLGLYAARDLGLMQLKKRDYPNADKSFIITAEEQRDYFKGVIKAAELCLPELNGMTVNIPHGMVKLSTGKMSSRTGDVIEIGWLFDQIGEAIKARGGEPTDATIAAALRYQYLRVRIGSDVVFDVNEAVSLQGNSGPYLQYAYARASSILAKSDQQSGEYGQLNDAERVLVRKMGEYAEVLALAITELRPHHLCHYLYELAQEFNRFYENNQVIGSDNEPHRLRLVRDYREKLGHGLEVLGIATPERL